MALGFDVEARQHCIQKTSRSTYLHPPRREQQSNRQLSWFNAIKTTIEQAANLVQCNLPYRAIFTSNVKVNV